MNYDLEERTTKFSKDILALCKQIKISIHNKNIIEQLIRSATSVGANYCEANGSSSRKDFRNKIHICKKEAQETRYWIALLEGLEVTKRNELRDLKKEAHELVLIFGKIAISSK